MGYQSRVVLGKRDRRRQDRKEDDHGQKVGLRRKRRLATVGPGVMGLLTGNLRNRRSQVRILSGALKIWLSDCDRRQPSRFECLEVGSQTGSHFEIGGRGRTSSADLSSMKPKVTGSNPVGRAEDLAQRL